MAPIEDLQARDLAWISDFVMQQMVIMLRPMMDHLQQTDATVDYAQRAVHRLSMDISEVRGDLERTNKYLAILRQGLGVQNEGKCVLQRGLDGTTRTVKRLEEQMDGFLGVLRSVEDNVGQLSSDVRLSNAKQEEISKRTSENVAAVDDLQVKVERVSNDTHSVKESLLNNETRIEVWQRELRELRRNQLGIVPKLEGKAGPALGGHVERGPPSSQSCRGPDAGTWPVQKKSFSSSNVTTDLSASGNSGPGNLAKYTDSAACSFAPENSGGNGSSHREKRISRVGSGSGRSLLQQDLEFGVQPRTSSRAAVWSGIDGGGDADDSIPGADEASASSRLPLLSKQAGVSRPPESAYAAGPRLRFSETMATPPSRGSPN